MQKIIQCGNLRAHALGLGTYKLTGNAGQKAIEYALRAGYRHIDTAAFYNNEQEVDGAVKNSGIGREDIFITTKVWPSSYSKKSFVPSVEESLRKLKTEMVDLLLLHWPADDETNKLAAGLLNECYTRGYAKFTGVSNFNVRQLQDARQYVPVFCNQLEYNPYKNMQAMLKYLQQQSILFTAYSPLARGAALEEPAIKALATKHNKTGSQIVLRWLLQQNVAAIPKASTPKHTLENMQVFDFELSDGDMQDIFALAKA